MLHFRNAALRRIIRARYPLLSKPDSHWEPSLRFMNGIHFNDSSFSPTVYEMVCPTNIHVLLHHRRVCY